MCLKSFATEWQPFHSGHTMAYVEPNLVIIVSADVRALNGIKPPTGKMQTTKIDMFSRKVFYDFESRFLSAEAPFINMDEL